MKFCRVLGLMGGVLIVLMACGPTLAGTTKPTKGQKKPPGKVTFIEAPSNEKPSVREKRLKRECKGRPNAGMCLGHTR